MLKTGHNYAKTLNSKNVYNELEEIECSARDEHVIWWSYNMKENIQI